MAKKTKTVGNKLARKPSVAFKGLRPSHDPTRYAVNYMDHAPLHHMFVFTDGLFKPLRTGTRNQGVDVVGKYKTVTQWSFHCHFKGPEALDLNDQSAFYFLCQLAASGNAKYITDADPDRVRYESCLGLDGNFYKLEIAVLSVSGSQIARGIGLTSTGSNTKAMIASLNRLATTTIDRVGTKIDEKGKSIHVEGKSAMVGLLCNDGAIEVVLCPEASWKANDHASGVVWMNMREARQHAILKSKASRRLHAFFCAWAKSHQPKIISPEALMRKIWGREPSTPEMRKEYVRTLKAAINQVAGLQGWVCKFASEKRMVIVRKPLFIGTASQVNLRSVEVASVASPTSTVVLPTQIVISPTIVVKSPTTETTAPLPVLPCEGEWIL